MIIRVVMLVLAAILAVFLVKAVVAVAIVGLVAFGCLFAFNIVRRGRLKSSARRSMAGARRIRSVTPLAQARISVRR